MSDAHIKEEANTTVTDVAGDAQVSQSKPTLASSAPRSQPLQPVVKSEDMSPEMKDKVIELAIQGMEKFSLERDLAEFLKRQMDEMYGSTWHVVCGKNFGSFVTHETKHFLYVYIGPVSILVWKTT